MIEIRFEEKLIKYEDAFLHFKEKPKTAENLQKLTMYAVLYSESLMDDEQASFIDFKSRVQQLQENAQVLEDCRFLLRFEYYLAGPIIDTVDKTVAAIEEFLRAYAICS